VPLNTRVSNVVQMVVDDEVDDVVEVADASTMVEEGVSMVGGSKNMKGVLVALVDDVVVVDDAMDEV